MASQTLSVAFLILVISFASLCDATESAATVSHTYYHSRPTPCRDNRRVRIAIKRGILSDKANAAVLLRAGFHDCFTATPYKADSGCNGSLRLREELRNPINSGFDSLRPFLAPILKGTCVSWADAFQMGTELSMILTGGPFVRLGRGRRDSPLPDEVTGEIPLLIDSFEELKALYARKGFNVREMVVSNVGGHALGGFEGTDGSENEFTPNPNTFNNMYAVNLVQRITSGTNLPGFNTLPSDVVWLNDPEATLWIKFYAGYYYGGFNQRLGLLRLKIDFRQYLLKQSRLSSTTVTA